MAVEDKYVDSAVAAGNVGVGAAVQGKTLKCVRKTFEVAAADDNNSVYRVFPDVNPELIPVQINVYNDAITGGTDYDLGLYERGIGGAVIDQDVLAATLNMSSGASLGSPKNGLGALNVADVEKALHQLVSQNIGSLKGGYDICVTAPTVGTAAGTITVEMFYIENF